MALPVIVVGGGISGLVCARALHSRGVDICVLEARDRIGGRLLSTPGGADLGASWAWPDEDHVASLARELGVRSAPQRLDGEAMILRAGKAIPIGNHGDSIAPCGPDACRWVGGYFEFAKRIAEALPATSLRLGCQVHAIEADGDGIRVRFIDQEGEQTMRARRVVVAMPPRVLTSHIKFLPALDPKRERTMAAVRTWAGDWAKVVAEFRSCPWQRKGLSGAMAVQDGGPLAVWWETAGGSDTGEVVSALAALAVGPGAEELATMHPAAVRKLAEEQLGALLGPEVVRAELLEVYCQSWASEELTHLDARSDAPEFRGDPRRHYGNAELRQPLHWGVHFAGTETEACSGHVEGAIVAGQRVSEEVLQSLSRKRRTSS